MLKHDGELLASASDIVNYLGCPHRTTLDLIHLETPLEKAPDDEQMELVQEKGRAHEAAFLEGLRATSGLVEIADGVSLEEKLERTREAMGAGARVIYQAALREGQFIGHADFLRRGDGKSSLGDFRYEVLDTKVALKTKAKFLIQLACYSDLVAAAQGVLPERAHLALGDGTEVHFRVQDYAHYYRNVRDRLLQHLAARPETYPEPVEACALCHWRSRCAAQWEADDHLSRVAGIRKGQVRRLEAAGIETMAALAAVPQGTRVARMAAETLEKLGAGGVAGGGEARWWAAPRAARGRAVPGLREAAGAERGGSVLRHGRRSVRAGRAGVSLRPHLPRGRRVGLPALVGARSR